jgi:hypothetical protein
MAFNQSEYLRRAEENVRAVERLLGKHISDNDQQAIGLMVYRQMRAEEKAGKEPQWKTK